MSFFYMILKILFIHSFSQMTSELAAVHNLEFIAHDQTAYNQWTQAFATVCSAYETMAAQLSVEQTMK